MAGLRRMFPVPGRGRRRRAADFYNPQALSNVQEEDLSCARDQVVIARPPAGTDTPMARYRRSLASKKRFSR